MSAASGPTYRHVYTHVPFCARRCSYCDFAIAVRRTVPAQAFVREIAHEIASRHLTATPVETLYLGGGTPSLLGGDGIARLLEALHVVAPPLPGAEITIEVNPEDVREDEVRAWVRAGVNRVSLGVQSFQNSVLQWMHRVHDAAAVPRAVGILRDSGLANLSVDLIFSVPSDLARDWPRDLDLALALEPTHVSLYGLTVEAGTPLGRWLERGQTVEAPEDQYEREFLAAHQALHGAGFEHYEVSNFGQPGHRARHNSAYWRGVPYLGLGPSAHGFDGRSRRWNVAAYAAWQAQLATGQDPMAGAETLTPDNVAAEAVYLGLRTTDGLLLNDAEDVLTRPWEEAGWVTIGPDGRLRCTPLGWLRLDSLAAALTAGRSP